MAGYKVQRPLTDDEMASIKTAIDKPGDGVDVLLAALRTTFNVLLADVGESWESYDEFRKMNPMEYAIPDGQWVQIGEWMKARLTPSEPLSVVNRLLDWMNVGPSGYREETDASRDEAGVRH